MPEVLDRVKRWIGQITEVGLLLVALGIVTQILFGRSATSFLGGDIVGNLTALISALGDNGLVGLIALAVILWLFWRRQPG